MQQSFKERYDKICAYIDANRDNMLEDWRRLVNIESQSADMAGVIEAQHFLMECFEKANMACTLLETGGAPLLKCDTTYPSAGKNTILTGHADTVFPKGSFGENPFRIEGDKAYGPGVQDMKGGLIIALYAIKALGQLGYHDAPIRVLICGDEENAHAGGTSQTAALMREHGRGGLFALNMETGRTGNRLVVERKGSFRATVKLKGVAAHSGNDFWAGRNAIVEAAHKAIAYSALSDEATGTTVNVGVIEGGTVANVVADRCTIMLNCRFKTMAERERLIPKLYEIGEKCYTRDVTSETAISTGMYPFERSKDTLRLLSYAQSVARACDLGEATGIDTGGSSDAPLFASEGVPTLCAFGVEGEGCHTEHEYAIIESLFDRCKWVCGMILMQENFQ